MADSPAVNEAEVVRALMQEYISARQEVLLHIQLWKTQERNSTILIALVGLLFPLLIGHSISLPAVGLTLPSTRWTDLVILFTISTVAFFMFFSALAIQFAMQVLAERRVRLEDEINKCLHGPYLVWERLAQLIWSNKSVIVHKMPDAIGGILAHLLIIVFAFVLPLYVLTKILCEEPDPLLKTGVSVYTWYLFTVLSFGFYINIYVTGALRKDCRRLFRHATKGEPPLTPSGRGTLPIIGVAAAAVAWVFITFIPHPTVCTYLGTRSLSPTSAPAAIPSPDQLP